MPDTALPLLLTRLRLTLPVKPFCGVTVSWVVLLLPWSTVKLVELKLTLKLGLLGEPPVLPLFSGPQAAKASKAKAATDSFFTLPPYFCLLSVTFLTME
jgi:hypothetical protein